MAKNNKAIKLLRGSRASIYNYTEQLEDGQPLYNRDDNYLTIGSASNGQAKKQPITTNKVKGYFADKDTIQQTKSENDSYYIGPSSDGNTLNIESNKKVKIAKRPSDIVLYNNGLTDVTLLDIQHPVWSIFETTDPNMDTPQKVANYFGGTWEVFGAGKVLVGYQSDDSDFNVVGHGGGSKHLQEHTHNWSNSHSHNDNFEVGWFDSSLQAWHTGEVAYAGQHTHGLNTDDGGGGSSRRVAEYAYEEGATYSDIIDEAGQHTHSASIYGEVKSASISGRTSGILDANGNVITSGNAGNLQPYIVVYRYRRTA